MEFLKSYKAREFNKGKSSQIFKEAHDNDIAIKVIRNSEEYVVILPYSKFIDLTTKAYGDKNEK